MFTGIVTQTGRVLEILRDGDLSVRIGTDQPLTGLAAGASIAVDGICLTAARLDPERLWFEADVSLETRNRTTAGDWQVGAEVNLERPMRVGDELGGHIVTGHVDDVAEVTTIEEAGDSRRVRLQVRPEFAGFIAEKGSVALNGVSLTVNDVEGDEFSVNLIPHTLNVTTWKTVSAGGRVNLEIDILARYIARSREVGP
ncbi:MAG: riboflavin synthase [Rhodobacteraceae bacterium]|nr:riboflavin synthase [Paracoccaceae bacterium]